MRSDPLFARALLTPGVHYSNQMDPATVRAEIELSALVKDPRRSIRCNNAVTSRPRSLRLLSTLEMYKCVPSFVINGKSSEKMNYLDLFSIVFFSELIVARLKNVLYCR